MLFLITILSYLAALVLIRPAPRSLKTAPLTFAQNLQCVRGSLFTGVAIVLVFWATSNFGFLVVDEDIFARHALSNDLDLLLEYPAQAVTHLFLHAHVIHLLSNLFGLGLLSVYERRVGIRRYGAVLLVASLASIPSVYFYSEEMAVCGLSGGLFGLAAAYFTDQARLSTKEWCASIAVFLLLGLLITLDGELRAPSTNLPDLKVDHLGHLLGALGAIVYCRLNPLSAGKPTQS